jgi:hypothetical protein
VPLAVGERVGTLGAAITLTAAYTTSALVAIVAMGRVARQAIAHRRT